MKKLLPVLALVLLSACQTTHKPKNLKVEAVPNYAPVVEQPVYPMDKLPK